MKQKNGKVRTTDIKGLLNSKVRLVFGLTALVIFMLVGPVFAVLGAVAHIMNVIAIGLLITRFVLDALIPCADLAKAENTDVVSELISYNVQYHINTIAAKSTLQLLEINPAPEPVSEALLRATLIRMMFKKIKFRWVM